MDYQRDEHRVHLIVYHLIWCPKRRKAILTGSLKARLAQLIEQKCAEKGWDILELAIEPDHLHVFVRVWPSDSVAWEMCAMISIMPACAKYLGNLKT